MKKGLIIFVACFFVGFVLGCDDDETTSQQEARALEAGQGDEADETDQADETAEADGEVDGQEGQAAEESAEFDYPGFDFDELSDASRAQLAGLALSELCPCPDAVVSLHECMQEEERCEEADEMAQTLVAAVSEGAASEDALDRVARERSADERAHQFILDDVPFKGNPDADIIIVEFADFTCPHCRTVAQSMNEVAERYGDEVGFYFKYAPRLDGSMSEQAARAAAAAHRQDRFWQMHSLIFANQHNLSMAQIESFAHQLGMNFERFQRDMRSPEVGQELLRSHQESIQAGVRGTPSLFINGRLFHTGVISAEGIIAEIRAELDES